MEKDRWVTFLKQYDSDQFKYYSKVSYAIENSYPDIAEYLILKGESYGQYPVSYLLPAEHLEKDKADPINFHFRHPLITAIRKGYTSIALLLIQTGDLKAEEYKIENKVEIDRKNAMIAAVEENDRDVVLALLQAGFDVNNNSTLNPNPIGPGGQKYRDQSFYSTPLLHAIKLKKLDIAELLLQHGADVEKESSSECLFEMLPYGGKINFFGSPLLKAVDEYFLEGISLLLRYGANPLQHVNNHPSPLDRAVQKGYEDIVDLLFNVMAN